MNERSSGRFFYCLVGIFAGLMVPVLRLLISAYLARKAWWDTWLQAEFHRYGNVYAVLAVCSVVIFAAAGYWLGKKNDEFVEATSQAFDHTLTLSQLAATDGLTGLFNARHMHEQLDVLIQNSHRSPLTCLIIDVDHFKKINDSHGHPFGDEVLKGVSQTLLKSTRRVDVVGRIGGEEFLVVLPDTPLDRGLIVAERIRSSIESQLFEIGQRRVPVSVSVGMAQLSQKNSHREALLKAADEALYTAKRSGRNQIVMMDAE